jgi:hypothetical protein
MNGSNERTCRIEILTTLMDELCAPDLALPRAKQLREKLFDLLARGEPVRKYRPAASRALYDGLDPCGCARCEMLPTSLGNAIA